MAYQTGTINSFGELKTILSAALTTNGWTEEVNGDVSLFKSGKCHVTCEIQDVPGIFDRNHTQFDRGQSLKSAKYEAFYYHNLPITDYLSNYALSSHWPITFAFDGIPEQEITFTWITGQLASAGKWSVSGSISGAFADAQVRVPYDDGGLSFGWSTSASNGSYHPFLEDPARWIDSSTPPQIIYPLAPEQNQAFAFRSGHESDGAGTLTGTAEDERQRRQIGFYSRQNDYDDNDVASAPNNIFPVTYHLHVLNDPNEVWLIIEDSRFEAANTSVRNTWLGFGETKSQAKGYYFTGSLAQYDTASTTNMVGEYYPFRYRSTTMSISQASPNNLIYNQAPDRTLNPFSDNRYAVLYDPVVGERYKSMYANSNSYKYGVSLLSDSVSGVISGHRRASYNRGHSTVLNQPWLCPITFEIDSVYRSNSVGMTAMVTAEINGVRHINMDGVQNGEVISDGAENWKCYAGFERGIGQSGNYTSGSFGFAVRYDGP
jgi:hypothetical protein